jgi:3,4-dihydroxy 2-butanone 4-phosphate synthase/GTP cyclohydrolase II
VPDNTTKFSGAIASAERIIEAARAGKMFILVDDEHRENEGDLVIPAEMADAAAINFMARYGRGLICLAMTRERIEHLGLPFMARSNGTRHQTAFTVSIEAREGVSTGISAADRAQTVKVAIDPAMHAADIVSPGHVFPLMARDGGVLVRAGHTEASVDVARLAGLNPSGVICEIMNDDGTMARMPELIAFAARHDMLIGTIADLIAYRRRHDRIVEKTLESDFSSIHGGEWRLAIYTNRINNAEHVALIKGDVADGKPVLARVHGLQLLDDVLGDNTHGKGEELHRAMRQVAAEGRGVVLLLREPLPSSLSDRLRARLEQRDEPVVLRDYGVGAQILLDLGVRDMILLSNSEKTIAGLEEAYGLRVVERRSIEGAGGAGKGE